MKDSVLKSQNLFSEEVINFYRDSDGQKLGEYNKDTKSLSLFECAKQSEKVIIGQYIKDLENE